MRAGLFLYYAGGDKLSICVINNGSRTTSSASFSNTSGNLKIVFDNSTGYASYYFDDVLKGSVNLSGLQNSDYYAYITAYTSNQNNRILCQVDNFSIEQ